MSEQIEMIAQRIKELRDISDMTVEQVAVAMNIDAAEYVAYESGADDIPISILYKAAQLFGVDMTEILTGDAPKMDSYCLVRQGAGLTIERFKGYDFKNLAYKFKKRMFEPLLVTLSPESGVQKAGTVCHGGQEFNYVIEGTVKITWNGKEFLLNKGDSFFFDPRMPHGQEAYGDKEAKFLTIILE